MPSIGVLVSVLFGKNSTPSNMSASGNPMPISGSGRLHWGLDVTFREDDSRTREPTLGSKLSWLRRFAVTLLKRHPAKDSIQRRCSREAAHPGVRVSNVSRRSQGGMFQLLCLFWRLGCQTRSFSFSAPMESGR